MFASPPAGTAGGVIPLECSISASGWLRLAKSELTSIRSQLGSALAPRISVSVLKQADDQAVVALEAMRQSIAAAGLPIPDLAEWGLVATARTPGRKRIVDALTKFREQGAWTMSPHIIPHCSLHSVPGLLSQALGLHGPNIGTGGLPDSEAEAIWAGLALLHGERLPGVWIIFSAWENEDATSSDPVCQAAVLGLRNVDSASTTGSWRIEFGERTGAALPLLNVESLIAALRDRTMGEWNLGGATGRLSFRDMRLEAAA